MKKILTVLCMIFSLALINGAICYADEVKDSVDIKLKIGDKNASINGELQEIETAPFINNDSAMVPLRAISEAFGAKVEWDDGSKLVTLTYKGRTIKLTIGSYKALVNKKEFTLSSPPVISKEGITMIPLRFVSENLGAKVTWFDKTKEILIVYERIIISKDNSKVPDSDGYEQEPDEDIVDSDVDDNSVEAGEPLFQNITESKIGDSYYGWSMLFPRGYIITKKEKNGTNLLIGNKNDSTTYGVSISKISNTDSGTDVISLLKELSGTSDDYYMSYDNSGYKVINQEITETLGHKWAAVATLYNDESFEEVRATVYEGYVYKLYFSSDNIEQYTDAGNDNSPQTILNSFGFGYKGNEKNIRDINELENGCYTYNDLNYGWSIKLPVEFDNIKNINSNVVEISKSEEQEEVSFLVEFYSLKKDESLDDYVNEEVKKFEESYNNKYCNVTSISDFNMNGLKAKKVLYEIKHGKKVINAYGIYFINDKIKYGIGITGDKVFFTDEKKKSYDELFKTFTPIEPIIRPKEINISSLNTILRGQTSKIENLKHKWSLVYPAVWERSKTGYLYGNQLSERSLKFGDSRYNSGSQSFGSEMIADNQLGLVVKINTYTNKKLSDLEKEYDEGFSNPSTLLKSDDGTLISKDTILDKGTNIIVYKCQYTYNDLLCYETFYLFEVNNILYEFIIGYPDITASENNLKILDDIWKSFVVIK